MEKYYLAIDIGASSGRHIVGKPECGEIKTEEVYRFSNEVKMQDGHLVWDIALLWQNVLNGIKAAFERFPEIYSVSIDIWGVDYVLMRGDEEILPCYAYRDKRTEAVIDEVHKIIPFEKLYERTGIQFQPFNTIYQLYDDLKRGRLDGATDYLMLPEYFTYKLTGVKAHEYTNATTTGLVNGRTREIDTEIIKRLGLPERLFTKLVSPASYAGEFTKEVQNYVGGNAKVIYCASHDTASAVEGIPMDGDSPYISSGTWSLLGIKVPQAITDENSRRANYSNEGGVSYVRYQKNIMGMWVVNRLRDELCPEKPFPQIVEEARQSGFEEFVDVNDGAFLAPESMRAAFDNMLKTKPKTESDYFRCAFLSLAQSYKKALEELKANSGKNFDTLYIVGGGAKNGLLNEFTESICGVKVRALPIEATALGNLKIQIDCTPN